MQQDNKTTDFHKCINSMRQTVRLTVDYSRLYVWRVKDLLCRFWKKE